MGLTFSWLRPKKYADRQLLSRLRVELDVDTDHGESFSISDITRTYVKAGRAAVLSVGEETWVDCGTPDSLLQASQMAKDGKLDPTPHR